MAPDTPIQTTACEIGSVNFCAGAVPVDQAAIDSLNHMRAMPADGARIYSAQTNDVWIFAGGAPIQTSSCEIGAVNFCENAVPVDQAAVDSLNHMRAEPATGTVLRYEPSGRYLQFLSTGYCDAVASSSAAVPIDQTHTPCRVPRRPGRVAKPSLTLRGAKIVVRWRPAASNGAPISSYTVKISNGTTRTVNGSVHTFTSPRLRRSTYRVSVAARNSIDRGSASPVATIRVR